jgi:uncharacterized protein (DUF362 family)
VLRLAATGALAAGTVAGGVLLADRKVTERRPLIKVRDHRVTREAGMTGLAVARGPSPAENARRAVEALGGMAAFVRPGERVVIKPNAGWNRTEEQAANTNPDVVGQLVRMARAAGASKVWVTDVPVNVAERCFERSGLTRAVGEAGGTLVLPGPSDFRLAEVGGRVLRVAEVVWPLLEADRVINVPVVKHHSLTGATMCLKNWFGVIGGHRVRLHQDIHRAVVDLAGMVRPTLTVMDATRVMVANGPSGGSLDDVKRVDTVVAGVDEVAMDAYGASFLGLAPADVGSVAEGERAGLGTSRWQSLKVQEISG